MQWRVQDGLSKQSFGGTPVELRKDCTSKGFNRFLDLQFKGKKGAVEASLVHLQILLALYSLRRLWDCGFCSAGHLHLRWKEEGGRDRIIKKVLE